jgi:hypothetical protein
MENTCNRNDVLDTCSRILHLGNSKMDMDSVTKRAVSVTFASKSAGALADVLASVALDF